jgi:hypothetical protein
MNHSQCAGLRVGGLYTYNANLIHAYGELAHFGSVSNLAQWQLIELLKDEVFIDNFIAQNSLNLKANCEIVMEGLDDIGIPYIKPQVQHRQDLSGCCTMFSQFRVSRIRAPQSLAGHPCQTSAVCCKCAEL